MPVRMKRLILEENGREKRLHLKDEQALRDWITKRFQEGKHFKVSEAGSLGPFPAAWEVARYETPTSMKSSLIRRMLSGRS